MQKKAQARCNCARDVDAAVKAAKFSLRVWPSPCPMPAPCRDEFTSYMLLQRAAESSTDSTAGAWRLFPEDPSRVMGGRPGAPGGGHHHDQVDRLLSCSQLDKVITCGRDGSVRLWNAPDLTHMRTLSTGGAWPTAVLFLPRARKLVVTAMDRSISYYDTNRCAVCSRQSWGRKECM
jgi:WD40 repeat protein